MGRAKTIQRHTLNAPPQQSQKKGGANMSLNNSRFTMVKWREGKHTYQSKPAKFCLAHACSQPPLKNKAWCAKHCAELIDEKTKRKMQEYERVTRELYKQQHAKLKRS